MIKLYWSPRSRSFSAIWLLEEAGLPYERVLTDISTGAQKAPEFLKINPMGKVPALTDGEAALGEAAAICAYVADRYPETKLAPLPSDPRRARYLQWLFFSPGCIEPAYLTKSAGITVDTRQAGFGDFDRVFDVLAAAVEPGPWLLGERFSAADVLIGADLYFGMDIFKIVPERLVLRAFVDRCLARPAFQRARDIDAAGV